MILLKNNLGNQTSPYLLQHAENPVQWYPWCQEAFQKAQAENKPVFLSIGYSTCHWCHVMAHESFENEEIAQYLNNHFVSIKVDKEERPDIDSIYMAVCQAYTGHGGWPTSIFMTAQQKPFFAGTYFPPKTVRGMIGFLDLIKTIHEKWQEDPSVLAQSAEQIIAHLNTAPAQGDGEIDPGLTDQAALLLNKSFDPIHGGFGDAPKFPSPHTLLFLLNRYETIHNVQALKMAEVTLTQLYKGGIFDHIGYGFSRYSTDKYFLVPHFEKMLYDNAMLLIAYTQAFAITKNPLYKEIAQKTAHYVLREMTATHGGFYSAQDADSDGVEGKYYLLEYDEVIGLLGKTTGKLFCAQYGITKEGNFEGKNIPNLLGRTEPDSQLYPSVCKLYEYRKSRAKLHLDDKILTSWNSLMIAAFALMHLVFGDSSYLDTAENANRFVVDNLTEGDTLFVSTRNGIRSEKGFLDDYAFYTFALITLYEATLNSDYLERAMTFCNRALQHFYDHVNGGFYLYGSEHQQMIIRPKETYDGAIPSGNSMMAYCLVKLAGITKDNVYSQAAQQQLAFLSHEAQRYPAGYCFYLLALSIYSQASTDIVCVLKTKADISQITHKMRLNCSVRILESPTSEYPLIHDKTTFYVCHDHSCLPPVNDLSEVPCLKPLLQ
ncbi:MAG: thioredoxin domain-containing protein [Angelakisella sp.]